MQKHKLLTLTYVFLRKKKILQQIEELAQRPIAKKRRGYLCILLKDSTYIWRR